MSINVQRKVWFRLTEGQVVLFENKYYVYSYIFYAFTSIIHFIKTTVLENINIAARWRKIYVKDAMGKESDCIVCISIGERWTWIQKKKFIYITKKIKIPP